MLAWTQLINLDRKKEHHHQLAAKVPDSLFLHLRAPVLTNAQGLVLWSVRTVDCYGRFDAADTEPKRNDFNGRQKSGREKRLIILLLTALDFLPWVAINDWLFFVLLMMKFAVSDETWAVSFKVNRRRYYVD